MPAQLMPGSNGTADKYVDGTPLYRMDHVLARGHQCGTRHAGELDIRPAELRYSRLYEALRRTLLAQALIHCEETTVQVLKEPGRAPHVLWCASTPCQN